jgi:hypothetical protein
MTVRAETRAEGFFCFLFSDEVGISYSLEVRRVGVWIRLRISQRGHDSMSDEIKRWIVNRCSTPVV